MVCLLVAYLHVIYQISTIPRKILTCFLFCGILYEVIALIISVSGFILFFFKLCAQGSYLITFILISHIFLFSFISFFNEFVIH